MKRGFGLRAGADLSGSVRGVVTPDCAELERQASRTLRTKRARPLLRRQVSEGGHMTRRAVDDDPFECCLLHT
jgi:hypothetical protein